ncbi:unnamed protein product, partial [Ectocarpus sp. 12 AP-2014]
MYAVGSFSHHVALVRCEASDLFLVSIIPSLRSCDAASGECVERGRGSAHPSSHVRTSVTYLVLWYKSLGRPRTNPCRGMICNSLVRYIRAFSVRVSRAVFSPL